MIDTVAFLQTEFNILLEARGSAGQSFYPLSRRKLGFRFPRAHLLLVPLLLQFSSLGISARLGYLPEALILGGLWTLIFFKLPASWNCQKSSFALKLPNSFFLLVFSASHPMHTQLHIWQISQMKILVFMAASTWGRKLNPNLWDHVDMFTSRRLFPLRPSSFRSSLPSTIIIFITINVWALVFILSRW